MKQSVFPTLLGLTGAGLLTAFTGCANNPPAVSESWTEPRPLGNELSTFRPPRDATLVSDQPPPPEEPIGAITLRQALALSLARNPELAAFSWEVRIGEARVLQASLRPNPEAGVEVENVLGTGNLRGAREAETTLQLSQIIEFGGKRMARLETATFSRDLAGWDYETARLDVFTRTAEAFIEVLSLQQRLALAEETVRLAEEALDSVIRRVEAARTFAVERTKAEVALASVQIERDQAQRALDAARQRLAANWGNSQPRFDRVQGDIEQLSALPELEQLRERLRQNPEIARWPTEILKRAAALKLERSKRVPDLAVGGGYRRLSGPDDHAFVAGVSIPLPLFNRNQGNIQEAEFRLARARQEQQAAELRVKTALEQAWQRVSAARAEVAAIKEKVLPGARETFETVRQYYTEGRLGYLEVLDAQRTLFAARAQYYGALSEYHQAVLAIERLIGEPLTAMTDPPQ